MTVSVRKDLSPQARGRELAREGRRLWQELGSVKSAAAELMSRHRDVPSIQAYRYASGLSQDQAASRYNEVAQFQTSLGGTTINAWETWARGRGSGSPPSFTSLLMLATAYGGGPLGVTREEIAPGDLVVDVYERLPPEDQVALKHLAARQPVLPRSPAGRDAENGAPATSGSMAGPEFLLDVPTVRDGNSALRMFSLPNPEPGQLLDLDWETFGLGVERLIRQIKSLGRRLDIDICFGVNEAGLVMATFLASAQFGRCAIGYLRCNKVRDEVTLAAGSFFPAAPKNPSIMICDFEVKHADVVGFIASELRQRYPQADLYFAVFGAMTKVSDLCVEGFDDLVGARIMRAADFSAVFIAATMNPPGIESPLELR